MSVWMMARPKQNFGEIEEKKGIFQLKRLD